MGVDRRATHRRIIAVPIVADVTDGSLRTVMEPNKVASLALIALALATATSASTGDPHTQALDGLSLSSWSEEDGLPSSQIWSIAQDAAGYLWLGTDAGLVRFDGVRFVHASSLTNSALPDGVVSSVYSARDGSLWVGFGDGGGIARIRDRRVDRYDDQSREIDAAITFFFEDGSGATWAGSLDGLHRFRGDRWERVTPPPGPPNGSVYSAYEDRAGNLWIGTITGAYRRRAGDASFDHVEIDSTFVRTISQDAGGTLWITDRSHGFAFLDDSGVPHRSSRAGNGVRLLPDRHGCMWVATSGQGLWRVCRDAETGELTTEAITVDGGLSSDTVRSLLEDRQGNIWVGTVTGLHRFTPHAVTPISDLGFSRAVAVTGDGNVWVGTGDGLAKFSGGRLRRRYRLEDGLPSPRVTAMHADGSSALWVATNGGLVRISDGRILPEPLPAEVKRPYRINSFGVDSRGTLWLCDTDQGVFSIAGGRATPLGNPERVRQRKATFVHVDSRDRVWIGFTGGHLVVREPDRPLRFYGPSDGLAGIPMSVHETGDGAIWLGGTHGLARLEEGRSRAHHFPHGPSGVRRLCHGDRRLR